MDLVIGKTARFVFMTTVERKRHYGVALAANKTAEAVKNVILEALSP